MNNCQKKVDIQKISTFFIVFIYFLLYNWFRLRLIKEIVMKEEYYKAYINEENPNIKEYVTSGYATKKVGIAAGASTPAYIIKEVIHMLEEKELNFEEALENTLKPLNTGDIVKGTIIKISPKEASVDLGTKHDGVIPADQVSLDPLAKIEDVLSVGQEVEAFVVRVNDKDGYVTLSLKKLLVNAAQQQIVDAYEKGENVRIF